MARVKKTETAPPRPKHWSEIKHGCCSCRFYKEDPKNYPCKPCTTWSHWEDANPTPPRSFTATDSNVSSALPDIPEELEFVLPQETTVSEKIARKPRKTTVVSEDETLLPVAPAPVLPKRSGRPKKTVPVSDIQVAVPASPSAEPKKRAGRPKKTASKPQEQPAFSETDQLTFGL